MAASKPLRSVLVASLLVSTFSSCHRRDVFARRGNADFFIVSGEYSLVLLHEQFLNETFGQHWKLESLYYGCNRALNEARREVSTTTSTLFPLAKGAPILTISGSDWSDLSCVVFSTESRWQALLEIDLRKSTVSTVGLVSTRTGGFQILQDGRLAFSP